MEVIWPKEEDIYVKDEDKDKCRNIYIYPQGFVLRMIIIRTKWNKLSANFILYNACVILHSDMGQQLGIIIQNRVIDWVRYESCSSIIGSGLLVLYL